MGTGGDAIAVDDGNHNRGRCHTDPTDRGTLLGVSAMLTSMTDRDAGRSCGGTIYSRIYFSSSHRKRLLGSSPRRGLRKMLFNDDSEPPPQYGRDDHRPARSVTFSSTHQDPPSAEHHGSRKSPSMPFGRSLSSSGVEVTIENDDNSDTNSEEEEPSREWFWIWP